jgi:hypothetical protein
LANPHQLQFSNFVVNPGGGYTFQATSFYTYRLGFGAGRIDTENFNLHWGALNDFSEPQSGQFTTFSERVAFYCGADEPFTGACSGHREQVGVNESGQFVQRYTEHFLFLSNCQGLVDP